MFRKSVFLFSFILLLGLVNNGSAAIWNTDADLYDDGVIDWLDVWVMAGDWLEGDSYVPAGEPDPTGLLAHYTFDDGTAVNSGSVGAAADGTPFNGAVIEYDAGGNGKTPGNVLVLNGGLGYGDEQYVDIGGGGGGTWADITGNMTVAAWIKPDLTNTTTNFMSIVSKGDGENGDNGFSLGRYGTTNNVSFVLNCTPWNGLAASPADGWDGQWHHVAGTYTASGGGAGVRIYVDGVERGYLSRSGPLLTNSWDVIIGGNAEAIFEGSGYRHWDGSLDDVRIYSRALSQSEIGILAGEGELYVPLNSPANLYDAEPPGLKVINFKDYAIFANSWLAVAPEPVNECDNWQTLHPEWIFCDDFEDGTALVREGRYFEYNNDGGDFIVVNGVGVDGSKAMRALYQAGEVGAGWLSLGFGRVPQGYFDQGIRNTEDFREIYYRMYLRMQPGWVGSPAKLTRATSFASSTSWAQAMIAHLWSSGNYLLVDPASGVENGVVVTTQYNDFSNLHWLGSQAGVTPIFDSQHDDTWFCIEMHVKLNDPGSSNGIQEFWIDGNLEARRDGLNFVDTWTDYAINAIFFENYWNSGSVQLQERYFDNIVVSTQPIGPAVPTDCVEPPSGLVSWWLGDGDADDIWSDNHGTLMNGATFATGKVGQAFSLDGLDDYVEVPDTTDFNFNQPLTVEAWVFPNDNSNGGIIGQWGYGGEAGDAFMLSLDASHLRGTLLIPGLYHLHSNSEIGISKWTHVAMVYDGSVLELYVDGELDASGSISADPVAFSQTIKIGLEDIMFGQKHYLDGLIDEVAIWNRALTADEILAIYNAGGMCAYEFRNTPTGSNVIVHLGRPDPFTGEQPVTMTFAEVTERGVTSLITSSSGPEPPAGSMPGDPETYYDITTTATFDGDIGVSIDYSGITFECWEEDVRLYHAAESGEWVDVTVLPVDTVNKIIRGRVGSLSLFAIFGPENQPPEVTINSPASGLVQAVNTPIDFVGNIIDPDTDDTHTATWTISNENWPEDLVIEGSITGNTVSNPVEFVNAGIYSIKLTVTDEAGESGEATTVNNDPECPAFIVIYDQSAGFVTGGGWIYSPAGALLDSTAEGKASFGFVAKYKKGATVPTGNTEFRFRAGNFRFKSSSYEWLVVAGKKAMFKGEGSIDGMDGSFKFMLTGVDNTEDKFRIKISDPAGEDPIYDNKRGEGDDAEPTTIGGGSIVIHGG